MAKEYDNYGDWYDNGPGSERFKRELVGSFQKIEFPNLPGFPFYNEKQPRVFWTLQEKQVKKEYLPEELFEI